MRTPRNTMASTRRLLAKRSPVSAGAPGPSMAVTGGRLVLVPTDSSVGPAARGKDPSSRCAVAPRGAPICVVNRAHNADTLEGFCCVKHSFASDRYNGRQPPPRSASASLAALVNSWLAERFESVFHWARLSPHPLLPARARFAACGPAQGRARDMGSPGAAEAHGARHRPGREPALRRRGPYARRRRSAPTITASAARPSAAPNPGRNPRAGGGGGAFTVAVTVDALPAPAIAEWSLFASSM